MNTDQPLTTEPKTESDDWNVTADKQLRKDIDTSLQNLKQLDVSRERALAVTKLQEAIMWLGMDLKRLNEPNPYPHSYDPSNTIVAWPRALKAVMETTEHDGPVLHVES